MELETSRDKTNQIKGFLKPGHMIHTLMLEHEIILGFLDKLERINQTIQKMERYDQKKVFAELKHIANLLLETESHHKREEDVLFPELEKRGVLGPPQIMKIEHEDLRKSKKELKKLIAKIPDMNFNEFRKKLGKNAEFIIMTLRDHILKENNILYPTALEIIKEKEVWQKMKEAADQIGYCCFTPKK